jgi:hypothetical protein
MNNMANSDILTTIQGLRAMLETLEAQVTGNKAVAVPKAPTAEKPKRQASDALKAWNSYVDKVKLNMEESNWTHPETGKPVTRKDAMQEASRRRATDPDAPKPKPKEASKEAPKAEAPSDGEAKPKPKKVLTEEHKAKLAAGRKAAAERRKAEKAALEPPAKPKAVTFAPPPLPASDDEEDTALLPLNLKGKKFLYNPETNGCYNRLADGTQGSWAGLYDPHTNSIDASVSEGDMKDAYDSE